MAPKELVDLPAELLDRVYHYLDWDRTTDLVPRRESIINISQTCKHLRQSVIPLLFRNVSLSLRFMDGALTEPGLMVLRRQRPDLAQHIRCVYINTSCGPPRSYYVPGNLSAAHAKHIQPKRALFNVPEDLEDWLSPELVASQDSRHFAELSQAHRERADGMVADLSSRVPGFDVSWTSAEAVVRELVTYTSYVSQRQRANLSKNPAVDHPLASGSSSHSHETPHDAVRAANSYWVADDDDDEGMGIVLSSENVPSSSWRMRPEDEDLKRQTDALATVLLCIPAATTELVFEAEPHRGDHSRYNIFALHVVASALQLFGDRLEHLTIIMRNRSNNVLGIAIPGTGQRDANKHFSPEIIAQLTKLKTLVLSSSSDRKGANHFGDTRHDTPDLARWLASPAIHTLTQLEIWNMHNTERLLDMDSIAGFHALKRLHLTNICITYAATHRMMMLANANSITPEATELAWLRFMIDLRRATPTAKIELNNPHYEVNQRRGQLNESAVKWLMVEAVPSGTNIDSGREERLEEDFTSFLPLWAAEDSDRGIEAAKERDEKGSALADAAFCSRWKQFENVRRDQGEWTTV